MGHFHSKWQTYLLGFPRTAVVRVLRLRQYQKHHYHRGFSAHQPLSQDLRRLLRLWQPKTGQSVHKPISKQTIQRSLSRFKPQPADEHMRIWRQPH